MAVSHPTTQPSLFDGTAKEKQCTDCKLIKPTDEFHRSSTRRTGFASECKECRKKRYRRTCDQRKANPVKPSSPTRECLRCHAVKPVSEFAKSSHGREGLTPYCKICSQATCRNWYKKNKDNQEFRERTRKKRRDEHRQRRHGMTPAEYDAMHNAQNGLCAICGQPENARRRKLANAPKALCIDHDHRTNKRRSLLCSLCNAGLGHFRENIDFLKAAIAYLERHAQEQPLPQNR